VKRWQADFSAVQAQVNVDLAALALEDDGEVIVAEVERVKAEIAQVSDRLTALDRLQQALMRGEEALRTAVAKAEAAAREQVSVEAQWREMQREMERLQREVASQQDAVTLQRERLRALLAECGRGEACPGQPAETLEALRRQSEDHLRQSGERQNLTRQRAVLEESLKHAETALATLHMQSREAADKHQRLQAEAETLLQQCRDLFGERDADQAETQANQTLQDADNRLRDADFAHQQAGQAVRDLHTRLGELDATLNQREPLLSVADTNFRQRLTAAGLADEAAYGAACLPEAERRALAVRADDLSRRQLQLDTRLRETETRLQTEQARALTDRQPDELSAALTAATDSLTALQQAIGAVQQQLQDNADLRQSRQSLVDAIAARQRDVARWGRLNELIGAADGKKFRNFAQGLTFDILIHHANRQLHKLSDRYLLVRDDSQPLELNVMDNYQAGEIRPTRNLSGGESFLVSLALALGLSHMASRNVRVDSLFLDEGFGTLDEDALDTALSALSGLQQSGKLVGVISHVSQLKERIGTQIKVEPGAGGRSRVEGPGCAGG
jgi:exonuclease SbcC